MNADLVARIGAAGSLLGVPVTVTDADEWAVTDAGIEVGLGFHASRGYGPDETVALALREMWAVARAAHVEPSRLLRRRAIEFRRPDLAPLLAAIDQIHAADELLRMMPALRGPLDAAALRTVPRDLTEWPLHRQWVGLLLREPSGDVASTRVDRLVEAELAELERAGGRNALRRVLRRDRGSTGAERLERALAVLVPPYLRLLARDAEGAGFATAEAGSAETRSSADRLDLGLGRSGSADVDDADGSGDADDVNREEAQGVGDSARGDSGERDEHDDAESVPDPQPLGEREKTSDIDRILPTPMPATGTLSAQLLHQLIDMDDAPSTTPEEGEAGGEGRSGSVRADLAEYRRRLAAHRDEVRGTREVWRRVLADRLVSHHAPDGRPGPEGEVLDRDHLAQMITQVRAGVRAPDAFRQPRRRPKRDIGIGNTDYVLVLDRSASMGVRTALIAADAAMVMLEALAAVARDIARIETDLAADLRMTIRTAVIVFDERATVVKPLSSRFDEETRAGLSAAVRSAGGSTDPVRGLEAAERELGLGSPATASEARRRIVIFVSDGGGIDRQQIGAPLRRLRDAEAEVIGIGIGAGEEMRVFAPQDVRIASIDGLSAALRRVIDPSRLESS